MRFRKNKATLYYSIFLLILLIYYCTLFHAVAQDSGLIKVKNDSLNKVFAEKNLSDSAKAGIFAETGKKEQSANKLYEALYFYNKAGKLYDIKKNREESALILVKIGDVNELLYDFEKALDYNFKARQIFKDIKDYKNEAATTENIARLYINRGLENVGLRYNTIARNFYLKDEKKYKHELLINSYTLGNVLSNMHKRDSAIFMFKKALNYIDTNAQQNEIAAIYNNLGTIYSDEDKTDSAKNYFIKAYDLIKKEKNDFYKGIIQVNLGEIKVKEKKYKQGLQYYDSAKTLLTKVKAYDQLVYLYLDLKDYYKTQKDYKTSLEYFEKYKVLRDSILSADKLNKFAEIEKVYELKSREDKINLMQNEKLLILKENKIKSIWEIVLIVGLILIIFLAISVYRNMRTSLKNKELQSKLLAQEKQKLTTELAIEKTEVEHNKKDLENKNKELEHFALRIVKKNEFIETLEEIKAIKGTEEDKKKLLKITNRIRLNSSIEREVLDIESRVNEVYDGFFIKLDSKHPDLSKTERRLCSLMVLNLDTKDIASLLNITLDGVRKARHRLRKKLNLAEEGDIIVYLRKM